MKRRDFIGTALGAGMAATAGACAQEAPARQGGRGGQPPKTSTATVEKLYKIPQYTYANALEAAPRMAMGR